MKYLLFVLVLVALSVAGSDHAAESPARNAQSVVLLHGLIRTERAMRPLEKYLTAAGFEVHNLRYASTEKSPERLIDDLSEQVAACCSDARVVHFVGHSLGGILIRAYLAEEPLANVGRVVLIAPPNSGSELVDVWGDSALFRWVLGPTAQQLGTGAESFPNRLPPPAVEVGIIAGTSTVSPLGSAIIPGDDDGTVAVSRTELEGMTDFLLVPSSHTFIMRSKTVAAQVVRFLRTGRFRHERLDVDVAADHAPASQASPPGP